MRTLSSYQAIESDGGYYAVILKWEDGGMTAYSKASFSYDESGSCSILPAEDCKITFYPSRVDD